VRVAGILHLGDPLCTRCCRQAVMAVCWDASRGWLFPAGQQLAHTLLFRQGLGGVLPMFPASTPRPLQPFSGARSGTGAAVHTAPSVAIAGDRHTVLRRRVGQQLLDPVTPGKKKSRAKLLPQKEGRTPCWDRSCRLDPHTHLLALFDHSSWTVYFPTVLVFQAQMSPISPFESSYQP
jgi:hypothetical protein